MGYTRPRTLAANSWEVTIIKSGGKIIASLYEAGSVCLAGAPLFEGRWIPESGEIIHAPASAVMRVAIDTF